jgi:hypothetical protein
VQALRPLILTLTLVLHINCVGPGQGDQTIDIVYDPCTGIDIRAAEDTTPKELTAIDAAIEFWQAVSNVDISRDSPRSEQHLPIRFEEAALIFRGVYQDEVGDVIINRRLDDPNDLAITVAHELGHALGLPHIDDRDSVMNGGNLDILPLADDVDALGVVWGPCVHDDGPQPGTLRQWTDLRIHSQL